MHVWKLHISQWGASAGPGKHKAAGQVDFMSRWCTELGNVQFPHLHEFLLLSHDLKETSRHPCRNHVFPRTPFLHELCLGNRITWWAPWCCHCLTEYGILFSSPTELHVGWTRFNWCRMAGLSSRLLQYYAGTPHINYIPHSESSSVAIL